MAQTVDHRGISNCVQSAWVFRVPGAEASDVLSSSHVSTSSGK
jgi:hypothetical protein